MGLSFSSASSSDEVDQTTVQQFAGTCDFKCDNSINGVNVDLISTTLRGGLKITQVCSTDATCSVSTNVNALSDILAKADASTNAKDTGLFSGIGDIANSKSRVYINNYLSQKVFDECKVSSVNDARNINIFAANSYITGGIEIGQSGSTRGNCAFNTIMSAVQQSTGVANASATSGKDKKGEKCGSCSGLQMVMTYIAIGVVVIIALAIIAGIVKYFLSNRGGTTGTTGTATSSVSSAIASTGATKSFWSKLFTKRA
jgi:hypothetical protein